MNRPALNDKITPQDFKDFYWLKEELVKYCKATGINSSGGKIEITQRITRFLETGEIIKRSDKIVQKSISKFDWHKEPLTLQTVLTDNYRCSENVRAFFLKQIGSHFRFTVEFMKWTKAHSGKTLHEAIVEWKRLKATKKDKISKTEIATQFEYNQYMRDFLSNNPDKTIKDAMKYWKLKRTIRGSNSYIKADLDLE